MIYSNLICFNDLLVMIDFDDNSIQIIRKTKLVNLTNQGY